MPAGMQRYLDVVDVDLRNIYMHILHTYVHSYVRTCIPILLHDLFSHSCDANMVMQCSCLTFGFITAWSPRMPRCPFWQLFRWFQVPIPRGMCPNCLENFNELPVFFLMISVVMLS